MGGEALPVLPPLEVLTARWRLASKFPVGRPACGTDNRSDSALRFKDFVAVLVAPFVWVGALAAGLAVVAAGRATLLALASWEINGEDEDEPDDWFWLSDRLRRVESEALAGGEDPSGDGF